MKIIAEIANVHEGSEQYLLNTVEILIKDGISNIKFQYIVPSEFGNEGSSSFLEFDRLSFTHKFYEDLLNNKLSGVNVFFDIFGDESFNKVVELNKLNKIQGVKIHTTNSMDFELIEKSINIFEEVFISISGLTATEISQMMSYINSNGFLNQIVLFYGVQTYPTKIESIKLNKLVDISKIYNVKIGLSEHLDGDNLLARDIVSFAWLLGYDYIEKHVTLDRSRRLDDDHSALELKELVTIKQELNKIKALFADNVLELDESEKKYRSSAKKILVTNKNIKKGDIISRDDIHSIRQDDEYLENYINFDDVIGRAANKRLMAGEKFSRKSLDQNIYALIIVRSESTRYPEKCYSKIGEYESIKILINRIKKSTRINKIILCTTTSKADDRLEEIAKEEKISCIRGDENVGRRISLAFDTYQTPDFFFRLTGDNILVDSQHLDNAIDKVIFEDTEYYRHDNVIDGCDFEIVKSHAFNSLPLYYKNFEDNSEYMTLYLNNNFFRKSDSLIYEACIDYKKYRLSFDYEQDLFNLQTLHTFLQDVYASYENIYKALNENNLYKDFSFDDKSLDINISKRATF